MYVKFVANNSKYNIQDMQIIANSNNFLQIQLRGVRRGRGHKPGPRSGSSSKEFPETFAYLKN